MKKAITRIATQSTTCTTPEMRDSELCFGSVLAAIQNPAKSVQL
jgi:hypothetical protein